MVTFDFVVFSALLHVQILYFFRCDDSFVVLSSMFPPLLVNSDNLSVLAIENQKHNFSFQVGFTEKYS